MMAFKHDQLKSKPHHGFCPLASIPEASFPAFTAKGVQQSLRGVSLMGVQVGPLGSA